MKYIGYVLLGIIVLLGIWFFTTYQGINKADENIAEQWSNVEIAYQARADKSKNLLEIVKGAAGYESETLKDVVEARNRVAEIKLDPNSLTAEKMKMFEEAQGRLGGAIRLVFEQYPNLQAVAAFRDFQVQYEGMENRISTARRDYTKAVKELNTTLRTFPGKQVNSWFGLNVEPKLYFESKEGTENSPDIKFE